MNICSHGWSLEHAAIDFIRFSMIIFVKFVGAGRDMQDLADVIVTEIFDSELLGEGILNTMNHASAELLKVRQSL